MTSTNGYTADPTDAARESAGRAAGATGDAAEDVRTATTGAAENVRTAATNAAEDVRNAASDVAEDVRTAASDAAEAFTAQAKETFANAKEAADDGVSFVKAKYRENPALVIAVGAAALIGVTAILKGMFRR
ncbi:hypothetical protein ACFWN7_06865 [Agromyces sp. NPDC058484]|uniref:hypothetical protein n=1 Tax=Agromyces sp. NPDC058484 TaxID=3346524 RepID=UPI003648A245